MKRLNSGNSCFLSFEDLLSSRLLPQKYKEQNILNYILFFYTVVPCILILSKFFIYQLMHKRIALKRILKFALKQLLHVSVQSLSSGKVFFDLAKVMMIKIIN